MSDPCSLALVLSRSWPCPAVRVQVGLLLLLLFTVVTMTRIRDGGTGIFMLIIGMITRIRDLRDIDRLDTGRLRITGRHLPGTGRRIWAGRRGGDLRAGENRHDLLRDRQREPDSGSSTNIPLGKNSGHLSIGWPFCLVELPSFPSVFPKPEIIANTLNYL